MRVFLYLAVVGCSCFFVQVREADAYDVAPGCTTEEFLELFNADWAPDEIEGFCAANIRADGYDCFGGMNLKRVNVF